MIEQIIKFNAHTWKQHQRFSLLLSKPSSGYNTTKTNTYKIKYTLYKAKILKQMRKMLD